jgi:hypothetical protein
MGLFWPLRGNLPYIFWRISHQKNKTDMKKIKTLCALGAIISILIIQSCETVGEISEPGLLVPKTADQDASVKYRLFWFSFVLSW